MMVRPLSLDLRTRIATALNDGMTGSRRSGAVRHIGCDSGTDRTARSFR